MSVIFITSLLFVIIKTKRTYIFQCVYMGQAFFFKDKSMDPSSRVYITHLRLKLLIHSSIYTHLTRTHILAHFLAPKVNGNKSMFTSTSVRQTQVVPVHFCDLFRPPQSNTQDPGPPSTHSAYPVTIVVTLMTRTRTHPNSFLRVQIVSEHYPSPIQFFQSTPTHVILLTRPNTHPDSFFSVQIISEHHFSSIHFFQSSSIPVTLITKTHTYANPFLSV